MKRRRQPLEKDAVSRGPDGGTDGASARLESERPPRRPVAQAETALRASEERYRSLYDNLRDGVVAVDRQGRISGCNKQFLSMLGYTLAEVSQLTYEQITPARWHARERGILREQVDRRGYSDLYEKEYLRKDGSVFPVEIQAYLNQDSADAVTQYWAFVRDITDRKRAEQALRMETGRLERASYAAKVALWDWDLGTGVLEWSKVVDAMLGFDPGGFPRELQAWESIIHPDDKARVKEVLHRHLESGTPYEISYRVRRNDGAYVWWHDVGVAVRNERGEAIRMSGACVDITERKNLEDQRRELDARLHQTQRLESLGVLAGGIAHDFNNILMAILGHAELALDELAPLASGRESLEQIKTASLRAAELCTQMLAYSGKGSRAKRDFCLNSLVDEMLHMLRTCISKKCVLNLNLDRQHLFMHGDVIQIRQVLMNLVINASEAIGEGHGSITVASGAMDCTQAYLDKNYIAPSLPPGRYVYLEVSDTGCGMSRNTIQRMFEPFFTTKFTGRGLGLSAVLGIVQAHGGSLRVYSELGTGTTIKVLFPATAGTGAGGTESPAESHWHGRGTVLLVDDEEGVRAITAKMLERLGLDVLTASDGREGVAMYRDRQADIAVVLLDLTMPHMNGEEAFRALRQLNPDVRVILASGYSETDIAARFAGQGLAGCVQKPYTLAKLRSLLAALLPAAAAPEVTDRIRTPNSAPGTAARKLADPPR